MSAAAPVLSVLKVPVYQIGLLFVLTWKSEELLLRSNKLLGGSVTGKLYMDHGATTKVVGSN